MFVAKFAFLAVNIEVPDGAEIGKFSSSSWRLFWFGSSCARCVWSALTSSVEVEESRSSLVALGGFSA